MKKKQKNVQPAMEKKPEKSKETTQEAEVITPEPAQPKQQPPITLSQISEKQAAFEKDVENTFNSLIERLTPVIQLSDKLAQAEKQTQQKENPLGGMQGILPFLQMVMGQGGGGDSAFTELAKESMKADIAFTKALKSAVISKITGEATSDIARAATGT